MNPPTGNYVSDVMFEIPFGCNDHVSMLTSRNLRHQLLKGRTEDMVERRATVAVLFPRPRVVFLVSLSQLVACVPEGGLLLL